jgi:hypothetical protein
MNRILRHRPSPAMVVAFIALCVALAGTATALPGRNRVKKDDIARNAVRSKHIRSRNVRNSDIGTRAVSRSKIARDAVNSELVASDALTGADILESSLGTVPNATNASNAANASKVNGLSVQRFIFRSAPTVSTNVLNLGGLALNASCNAGTQLSVSATTTVGGAILHSGGNWLGGPANEQDFYVADDDFNPGDSFDPLNDPATTSTGSTNLEGSLVYARQDGGVVTASFLAQKAGGLCIFAGTAIG